jgi:hypothetical protein
MNILLIIFSSILINAAIPQTGYDFEKLAKVIDTTYPVWKINEKVVNEKGSFYFIFNNKNPNEIEIINFKQALNGQSDTLLSCYGRIIPPIKNGYIVGTAIEAPTFGKVIILDDAFQKVTEIDSQKVVKIKIVNLLGMDIKEIVTWEDHHYGTNTTRRVLNIYKIYPDNNIKRIFEHDLVDATFMPGGPHGVSKEIYYLIDYQTLIKQKKIIVINQDTWAKEIFSWNGATYKQENENDDCQQINPAGDKPPH